MRLDLPPSQGVGPFDELRDLWDRMHGPVDRTPRFRVAPSAAPRVWPREVRLSAAREHLLPGPPGGFAAGLVRFHTLPGEDAGRAAAVDDRVPLPPEVRALLARWELPGLELPLPGAVEYAFGPWGISAYVPPRGREAAIAVAAGASTHREVFLRGLEATPATVTLDSGAEVVFRVQVPAGGGEVFAWAGNTVLGHVRISDEPAPPRSRCELQVEPAELSVLTDPLSLRLRLARVAGTGPVEASVHVPLEPSPLHVPLSLAEGEAAAEAAFRLRPESLPRVEEGTLPLLLLVRGEAAHVHRLPFRRVRLRRSLPRADLRFSRYERHPHRHLSVRRSDGAPVDIELYMPDNLRPHLDIRRLADGRFHFVGLEAPPATLEAEVLARDALSGLEERIPVRLERAGGEGRTTP